MKRNSKYDHFFISFFIIIAIYGHSLNAAAQNKPNIILFIADDLNATDLGCYGNKEVKTPNIDRLAAEGLLFSRAYAASPMCSPSRSALYTGLYPFKNGTQMNHFTAKANTKSLPHFLNELGYRVVLAGKTHVGPEECFPFEHIGKEFGQYEPIENRLDRKKETVNMIKNHFIDHPDQPLCLIVAPWVPHVPWFPYKDFSPDQLTVPHYLVDTRETRQALASYYQSISEADRMFGEILQSLKQVGKENETVTIFIADQGAQFPSAKWTVYNQGIRVPWIIRWPGKIAQNSMSDALVSLVDIVPTMIDIAGGKNTLGFDGTSVKDVLLGKKKSHHDYIFAETSIEPHYWYNYTPARSVITKEGWHYIKNYHPGVRFITHIDKVERNEFYFDSWVQKATVDKKAAFLLQRYSYRPPEELYNLNTDIDEFENLVSATPKRSSLIAMRRLLQRELSRQGETDAMITQGTLPVFGDRFYTLKQNSSASALSFNKTQWNPQLLYITAYLEGLEDGGILCDYFNQFRLFAHKNKIGIITSDGATYISPNLKDQQGELVLSLSELGKLSISFNNQIVLKAALEKDLTKIKNGYVTNGIVQGQELEGNLQSFKGKIYDLKFSMNELLRNP